jgi:hypothetical protein
MVLAMAAKHPDVLVRLDGAGDDFRIIGQVTKAMRRAGIYAGRCQLDQVIA